MISEQEWKELKASESYGMLVHLNRKINNMENCIEELGRVVKNFPINEILRLNMAIDLYFENKALLDKAKGEGGENKW